MSSTEHVGPPEARLPMSRLEYLLGRHITPVRRSPSPDGTSSSTATRTCGPNDTTGFCQRSTDASSNTTLPIVLGIVIPLTVAIVIFTYLHRRHVKKLRLEDANDPHKSLDFGLGDAGPAARMPKKNKKMPEMSASATRDAIRRGRGLSMDLGANSPYLLPPGLHQSRESIHSLSRAASSDDDPYARATSYIPHDGTSSYAPSLRRGLDDSSSFTGSSRRTGLTEGESSQNLLRNAQRMSRSIPPASPYPGPSRISPPFAAGKEQSESQNGFLKPPTAADRNNSLSPPSVDQPRDSYLSTASSNGATAALRASNNYLGAFIRGGLMNGSEQHPRAEGHASEFSKPQDQQSEPPAPEPPTKSLQDRPPSHQVEPVLNTREPNQEPLNFDLDNHSQDRNAATSPPQANPSLPTFNAIPEINVDDVTHINQGSDQHEESHTPTVNVPEPPIIQRYSEDDSHDYRRSTFGIRPLPPDDPSENPEQRANRIRSFYKEYFEETKPGAKSAHQDYYDGSEYYTEEDYYYPEEMAGDDYYYPRDGPPSHPSSRFGGSDNYQPTHGGNFQGPSRPRAFSSATERLSPAMRGAPPRRKQLPPPKALHTLPTPHLLKDDVLPIDYAPPNLVRDQRAGTPDGLRGGLRQYSPGLPALALASSFDDLAAIPSPYALRKSGTFTALDFAPPSRFKLGAVDSDAGSIRSTRSGISAVHSRNVRNGAYRVSRLDADTVGTRDDLAASLRPQWGMRP